MLKTPLIHPGILSALGRAGHSSRVLISDGCFPHATMLGPNADLVMLNVSPGCVSAIDVLKPLLAVIPVDAAAVMAPMREGPYAMDTDPPIFDDFTRLLGEAGFQQPLEHIEREAFYAAAKADDVCLTIATGEQRLYGNLLLTIGAIQS